MIVQQCTEDSDWMRDYTWIGQDLIESTSLGIELQTRQLLDTSACYLSLMHSCDTSEPNKMQPFTSQQLLFLNQPANAVQQTSCVVTWSAIIMLLVVGLQWHCRGFYSGWMCGLISKLVAYQNPVWIAGLCYQNGLGVWLDIIASVAMHRVPTGCSSSVVSRLSCTLHTAWMGHVPCDAGISISCTCHMQCDQLSCALCVLPIGTRKCELLQVWAHSASLVSMASNTEVEIFACTFCLLRRSQRGLFVVDMSGTNVASRFAMPRNRPNSVALVASFIACTVLTFSQFAWIPVASTIWPRKQTQGCAPWECSQNWGWPLLDEFCPGWSPGASCACPLYSLLHQLLCTMHSISKPARIVDMCFKKCSGAEVMTIGRWLKQKWLNGVMSKAYSLDSLICQIPESTSSLHILDPQAVQRFA